MNKTIRQILVTAVAIVSAGVTLQAAQINGFLTINGGAELNSDSVNTATQVTGWLNQIGASPTVNSRGGDFTPYTSGGDPVTMTAPWSFNSGALPALWSVGGFTFNLTASSILFQGSGNLQVSGTGTITGNGFDPTPGTWSFSSQDPNAGGVFSFSAGTGAQPTPSLPCPAGDFRGGNTGGGAPGDISVAFDQFPAPNDNSYGVNAIGWGTKGHQFKDLTGSDKAGFQILRPNGTVAVSFNVDYITTKTGTPSGYASLGPFGGDGSIVTNSTPALTSDGTTIQWDTSLSRDLNGVQSPFGTYPPANQMYFMGGVQTIGTSGTHSAALLTNSPPVDCSLATDPATCISVFPAPKGIQYPLAVPNPWSKSYDNPEYTNAGGPVPLGAFDAGHVDGWNFHDTYFVTFKQAYLTAIGFDFSNYAIATYDSATNTYTCPSGMWCVAPNPTVLHNSPAKACPSPSPTPTPTPSCNLTVTNRAISGKQVQITIHNNESVAEFITNVMLSWPQGTNGNLTQIKLDGDVMWNGPAHASPINFGVPPLVADQNKRKIDHNSSDVLIFIFQNNVAPLNNAAYSGSATFQCGTVLDLGLPTP